jgi:hypothetical protein
MWQTTRRETVPRDDVPRLEGADLNRRNHGDFMKQLKAGDS